MTDFIAENTYLLDSMWVLVAAIIVFFMQAGFACCESGFARSKSASNIWMKNASDFCIGALVYYFIGFGIMYGDDFMGILGINGFLNPLDQDLAIWESIGVSRPVFMLFQTVFCATTATIISGAVAERFKFNSYIIVSILMTGLVYPIVGHWIWGGGWLSQIGFLDFAGSTAVHSVGAWASLVGASLVGPRIGKYSKDGKIHPIPIHNLPLGALGVFILWFGWYGFNPGSGLALNEDTFYTAMTTTYAGAAGGLAAMFVSWIRDKKPDVILSLNGVLAGLVASCTNVLNVSYVEIMLIGAIAGTALVFCAKFVDETLKVDDPVGAISVHGCSGVVGTLCAGLFFSKDTEALGLFHGGGFSLLLTQLVGVAAVAAFALGTTFIIFSVLKRTIGIRVDGREEIEGLDIHEHGIRAYQYDTISDMQK